MLTRKTPIKPGAKGLKRSPMKPGTKQLARSAPITRGAVQLRARKAAKDKPKRAARENQAIRKSAAQEACTIQLPGVCNRNSETVVWCHENSYAAGKGMGLKAKDEHGAYGCSACHAIYDGQAPRPPGLDKETVDQYFQRAKEASRCILEVKGII